MKWAYKIAVWSIGAAADLASYNSQNDPTQLAPEISTFALRKNKKARTIMSVGTSAVNWLRSLFDDD